MTFISVHPILMSGQPVFPIGASSHREAYLLMPLLCSFLDNTCSRNHEPCSLLWSDLTCTAHGPCTMSTAHCLLGGHDAGLDARAAAIVIRAVRRIAETGRTMAATVHQPAIDIFEVSQRSCLVSLTN